MVSRNKICDISMMFIIFCLILCTILTFSKFESGGSSIRFVRRTSFVGNKRNRPEFKVVDNTSSYPRIRSLNGTYIDRMKRHVERSLIGKLFLSTAEATTQKHNIIKRSLFSNSSSSTNSSEATEDWCGNANGTNETRYSCRERIDKNRLCDGFIDCANEEDEIGCFGCPKDSYYCDVSFDSQTSEKNNNTIQCFKPKERCDGKKKCANGKDERTCNVLSLAGGENNGKELFRVGYTNGLLYKNWKGKWYPVCGYNYRWARKACISELGHISELPKIGLFKLAQRAKAPYLAANGDFIAHCFNRMTYVKCPQSNKSSRFDKINDDPIVGSSRQNSSSKMDPIVGIVGGNASLPQPFVAAIYRDGKFHCGGTVINQKWILTAAHCLYSYSNAYYEIQVGIQRRSSYPKTLQIRHAIGIKIHPKYDAAYMINDIALIMLNEPLHYNKWVGNMSLPEINNASQIDEPVPGTICTTMGWGTLEEDKREYTDELQEVKLPIVDCKLPDTEDSPKICAGYKKGGRDACQGDSGGPLICNMTSKPYIAGIISYGIGCARENQPGVYTKVSAFVEWINKTIQERLKLDKPEVTCMDFQCNEPFSHCLFTAQRCNGIPDCYEAEDEAGCPPKLD